MPTIAYLGPEHTNTHLAALARFGKRQRYVHAPTVDDVFHLVERRQTQYGVVPVENSLEGAVTHTLDRFIDFVDTPVTIHGEIERPIRHYLIMRGREPLSTLKLIYSHPQAFAQCHTWLRQHCPAAALRETRSTAFAVWELLREHRQGDGAAAIGRLELAREHGLRAVAIPEQRENKTRFLIIGLGRPKRGRRNKTSMVFALKDRPGALYDALSPFKHEGINLTKIESRPSKKKAWEYYFFIDLLGHESDPRVQRALRTLAKQTTLLRVLGSYPMTKR